MARTLTLLAYSAISCLKFNMDTVSFGIDPAPQDKESQGSAVALPINPQPPAPLATTVNAFPRS